MRRQILEGQDVAAGKSHNGIRISASAEFAERLQHRDKFFDGPVVRHHDD